MAKKEKKIGAGKTAGRRSSPKSHRAAGSLPDRRVMEQMMRQLAAGLTGDKPEPTALVRGARRDLPRLRVPRSGTG